MEIVIRTDGDRVGVRGAGSQAEEESGSQQGAQAVAPPPAVAAQAMALGAINAGPAQIPASAMGEPMADIGSLVPQELSAAPGDGGATSAGPAPGSADEPPAVMIETTDGEG